MEDNRERQAQLQQAMNAALVVLLREKGGTVVFTSTQLSTGKGAVGVHVFADDDGDVTFTLRSPHGDN